MLFTGEMIYPWMFDTDPALRPLRETADLLAQRTDWPDLYAPDVLAANQVPVFAAVYHDDMYVDTADSLATADAVGRPAGLGDQRVGARRVAGRGPAGRGPLDRHGAGPRVGPAEPEPPLRVPVRAGIGCSVAQGPARPATHGPHSNGAAGALSGSPASARTPTSDHRGNGV